jgi:hypothetical protein
MSKPKKQPVPELISLADFARRAGVSRPAVTEWLNVQEEKGFNLRQPSGRRGKVVDANNPLIAAYINNDNAKGDRKPSGGGKVKSGHSLRKMVNQIEKTELQTVGQRHKYVSAKSILATMDHFLELEEQYFKPLPDQILDRIGKELKIKYDPKVRAETKKLLDKEIENTLASSRRINERFKKQIADLAAVYGKTEAEISRG